MSNLLVLFLLMFMASNALAKDWQIKMLNYGDKGGMVFEPDFVLAEVGDTVTFIPTNRGHNARSYVVPEGEASWKTPVDEAFTLPLNKSGLHFYYCPPHLMMGMVGIIQVGEATNIDKLMEKAPKLKSKVALSPQRVDDVVAQIIQ